MIRADDVRQIRSAASFGSSRAQLLLGQMFVDGNGVTRSQVEGRRWFEKAASSGGAEGINMLGRCHELGWGGPVDLPLAAACYRRAARLGHGWAQFNLACLLHDGRGVARDRHEACSWFARAARSGHAKAANMLGHYREEGWLHPPRILAALRWYARAAGQGDFRGQFNLARLLYAAGQRTPALIWLERSIAAGIPDFWADIEPVLAVHPDPGIRRQGAHARRLAQAVPTAAGPRSWDLPQSPRPPASSKPEFHAGAASRPLAGRQGRAGAEQPHHDDPAELPGAMAGQSAWASSSPDGKRR